MLIKKFLIDEREFSLFFEANEFVLSLKKDYREIIRKKDDKAKLFWDDCEYEDVDENINMFKVIIKSVDEMVEYVYKEELSYFYFHAATERKAKIYDRVAKRICAKLEDKFAYSRDDCAFYFYKVA